MEVATGKRSRPPSLSEQLQPLPLDVNVELIDHEAVKP